MKADLLIENVCVLTMDPLAPRAEAVALAEGRILAVGARTEVTRFAGSGTERVDARGATVLPGFIESHMHLFGGGTQLDRLSLAGLAGFDAIAAAVRGHDRADGGSGILLAEQASYVMFGEGEPITREALDRILPDRPLALFAGDHHTMWANTAALDAAGLLGGRALPEGNEVVMGADGKAAGELREFDALFPVLALTPTGGRDMLGLVAGEPDGTLTPAQRAADLAILRRALGYCASLGITSFHNMDGNAYQLALLAEIDRAEGLPLRGRVPFRFMPGMALSRFEDAAELRERYRGERLKADFVKVFMDGVIESTTAHMLADYSHAPGQRGSSYFEEDEFAAIATEADRLGFQVAVHAIGDAAVNRTLNGYEAARRANGPRDARHRVEHIETLAPGDISRFRELGVIASMQPTHAPGGAYPLEPILSMIGRERMRTAYPWGTLRAAGAHIAFSSDWPVAPLDPLFGIKTAMTRQPAFAGAPDERQTLPDALDGFTAGGAYAEFAETRKGVLKAGAMGDLVLLSGDIERTAPEEIDTLKVAMTVCGGKVTYRAA